jgi:hypothetical protein
MKSSLPNACNLRKANDNADVNMSDREVLRHYKNSTVVK